MQDMFPCTTQRPNCHKPELELEFLGAKLEGFCKVLTKNRKGKKYRKNKKNITNIT